MFKENKWAFVSYTGSDHRRNTSRWFTVVPEKWALLRHQLEVFGAEALEGECQGRGRTTFDGRGPNNTMIRGYEAFKLQRHYNDHSQFPSRLVDLLTHQPTSLGTEIFGPTYIISNTFIFLVHSTIPLGGKPYAPLHSKLDYNILLDNISVEPDNESLQAEKSALLADSQHRCHAADRPAHSVSLERYGVRASYEYLEPPPDYLCQACNSFGKHYKDACFLWPPADAKPGFQFGANKFNVARPTIATDAVHYGLLHKRQHK